MMGMGPGFGVFGLLLMLLFWGGLIALAVCLVGVQFIMGGRLVGGVLSITAAVLIIGLQVFPWPMEGGAIPQLLSCVPWSAWTLVFSVRLLTGGLEGGA